MIKPRKKLRTRLVIYNLSVILCVILASILFSAQYASNILRNQIIDGYSTALDLTAMHMRYVQADISQIARIIISDTQILEAIGTIESDTFDTISKQAKVSDLLMNYKTKENYIVGIDLILEDDGRIFVRILQENLKIGPEGVIATIAEEVQSVQSYAEIQTYRYPDRFSVKMNVDENTLEEYVPRFLVQPIVENALFHGILPMEKAGMITIDIKMKKSMLEIIIQDNGIGMSREKVEALFAKDFVSQSSQMRSIGLYNIRERMKRIYKDRFSLAVDSSPGGGTQVSISLPTKFAE